MFNSLAARPWNSRTRARRAKSRTNCCTATTSQGSKSSSKGGRGASTETEVCSVSCLTLSGSVWRISSTWCWPFTLQSSSPCPIRSRVHGESGCGRSESGLSGYAALIAVCGAHDFLCFRWGQMFGAYPIGSAVMVRLASEWREVLSALSGVGPEKCRVMLSDLTFSVARSTDLHVYPLIPLDSGNQTLAVAPPFPLHITASTFSPLSFYFEPSSRCLSPISDTCVVQN